MTGKEIIRELMERNGVTNVHIAKKLGVTPQTMWARINYKSVKDVPLSVFDEVLNALGYELVIREKSTKGEFEDMPIRIDKEVEERRGRPKKAEEETDEE